MVSRRFLLGSSALVTLWAAKAIAEEALNYWRRPNVAPLQLKKPEQAMELLNHDGIVPPDVVAKLLSKVASGTPDWTEPLPASYQLTRMGFTRGGTHIALGNVIAVTEAWEGATRLADFYSAEGTDGRIYLLIRPHVCNNWSLRIVTLQGVCIKDTTRCSKDCLRLAAELS